VINDGPTDRPAKQLYRVSEEGAMNGWAVLDSQSWFDQQGDQQRGFFPLLSPRNSVLIADGDFHDDALVSTDTAGQTPPDGEFQYNSFVQRQYDMSGFDNTTVRLEFDWETRLEDSQRLVAEVSFDYGQTWTTILDVDSDRLTLVDTNGDDQADAPAEPAYEAELFPFLFNDNGGDGFVSGGDVLNTSAGPQLFEFGIVGTELPAGKSNSMILRFGCLDAGNDWWAAVDNVRVQAATQDFLMGDGDGDGDIDFTDLDLFAAALFGAAPYDIRFDFVPDGVINFSDLNGFAGELFLFN
jgi:hypothetical protein